MNFFNNIATYLFALSIANVDCVLVSAIEPVLYSVLVSAIVQWCVNGNWIWLMVTGV